MASQAQELTTLPARLETLLEMARQLSQILPIDTPDVEHGARLRSLLNSDSVGSGSWKGIVSSSPASVAMR
jgi:hypothetical protein